MKSPKQRFQETQHSAKLLEIADTHFFQYALEAALLQMIHEQPLQSMASKETDTFLATANAFRVEGAKRFISILTSLPLALPMKQPTPLRDNLEP